MMPRRSLSPGFAAAGALLLAAAGCTPGANPASTPAPVFAAGEAGAAVRLEDVRATVAALSHDTVQGRATGTPGADRAARWLAAELARHGARPAGDSAFFQWVPFAQVARADGRSRLQRIGRDTLERVPAARRVRGINVVGIIPGSDPALRGEAVVVTAHYDHLGTGAAVGGDSVFNGADDNASGVTAVLETARALGRGPAPRRTVVFLLATGEELGIQGASHYLDSPAVPLERTVAVLAVEMIGRPDSLVGGAGRGWLTGFERSTMGEMLRRNGIPLVPDPRPQFNFFERSDNIVFARRGIPAHTLSSYNLHGDYHTVDDEADRLDYAHMARVTDAGIRAVRMLADGPAPQWTPGGRPTPRP